MTKPWEEEWEIDPKTYDPLLAVRRIESQDGQDREVARRMTEEEAEFIAAAPDMARALLRVVEQTCETARLDIGGDCATAFPGKPDEWCRVCEARAALTKAGVPLP